MSAGMHTYMSDGSEAEMIETDNIDVLNVFNHMDEIEKTSEPITEILSLEAAIDLVSNKIGVNSSYEVLSIELAYDILGNEIQGKGTPVWRFIVNNEKSEYSMVFSVDVLTGKVKYREL